MGRSSSLYSVTTISARDLQTFMVLDLCLHRRALGLAARCLMAAPDRKIKLAVDCSTNGIKAVAVFPAEELPLTKKFPIITDCQNGTSSWQKAVMAELISARPFSFQVINA
jgi:hypothetical protein